MVRTKIINIFSKEILNTKSISAEELLAVNSETSTFRCAYYTILIDPSYQPYESKYQLLEELNKFLSYIMAEFGESVSIDIFFNDIFDSGDVD